MYQLGLRDRQGDTLLWSVHWTDFDALSPGAGAQADSDTQLASALVARLSGALICLHYHPGAQAKRSQMARCAQAVWRASQRLHDTQRDKASGLLYLEPVGGALTQGDKARFVLNYLENPPADPGYYFGPAFDSGQPMIAGALAPQDFTPPSAAPLQDALAQRPTKTDAKAHIARFKAAVKTGAAFSNAPLAPSTPPPPAMTSRREPPHPGDPRAS